MERYVAGKWDDNSFNVYDRENGNYQTLSEAQEAASRLGGWVWNKVVGRDAAN